MPFIPDINTPPNLTFGDSGLLALLGSQHATDGKHFDPFPQPEQMKPIARLLNRLPLGWRIKIADRIGASIGRDYTGFKQIDPEKTAEWAVSGYKKDKYKGVILGAPGIAVSFLSAITGFPYLPQPFLFNARRDMRKDDSRGYLSAGTEIAQPLVEKYPSIEATIHFDPVHDRFLIGRVVFVRIKLLDLPDAYRKFIETRLEPGSTIILLDCKYTWKRAEISPRLFFQLGGLGGFSADDYLDEIPVLKDYRSRWGAPSNADWSVDYKFSESPESEWGTVGAFLNEARDAGSSVGHRVINVIHHDPSELSAKVFRLYRKSWRGQTSPKNCYISVFTNAEPRFPMATGTLPIWLPFITDDSYKAAGKLLSEWRDMEGTAKPGSAAYMTLHPSFCFPPDLVGLDRWRDLLSEYFDEINFIGVDPGRYPADLGSYVSMYPELMAIASKKKYDGTPFDTPSHDMLTEAMG